MRNSGIHTNKYKLINKTTLTTNKIRIHNDNNNVTNN